MKKKILILLSAYNGEKYLCEQLDSILNQEGVEIGILVRDDGSKDSTVIILEEYSKRTNKITLIKGNNCGSAKSFLTLINEAIRFGSYEYFAFCDQDDVWLSDKLSTAVSILEAHKEKDKPALYLGSYQMVDSDLNKIPTAIGNPKLTLPAALISNCATGCTMVFNKELLYSVACSSENDIIMHDYWMYVVCLAVGGFVYYDPAPHILYRQHANNVIGGMNDNLLKRWTVRLKKLFKRGDCFKSKFASKLLYAKGIQLNADDRLYLQKASTCNNCLSSKLWMLRCKENFEFSLDKNLQTIGLILTGKF